MGRARAAPSSRSWVHMAETASGRRPQTTNSRPASANVTATLRPNPPVAPVIKMAADLVIFAPPHSVKVYAVNFERKIYSVNLRMPFPARIDAHRLGADALRVAEARGWDSWTLRDVAGELGVTPNALYRHVGDRAGLIIAMGQAAAQAMHRTLRPRRGDDEPTPDDAVVRLALRFVRFATRRPHAYAAFMDAKPALDHPAHAAWRQLWGQVHTVVAAALPEAADAGAFALWALLHGRVGLAQGAAYRAPVDAGLEAAVRAVLEGFRARSPVPSPLPPHVRKDPA